MALESSYVELTDYTSTSSCGMVSYIIHCLWVYRYLTAYLTLYTQGWPKLVEGGRVELVDREFGAKRNYCKTGVIREYTTCIPLY